MAGGWAVHHDEIGGVGPLQLHDLAQDEEVPDARNGRGRHVEHPRLRQVPRRPAKAVVDQVIDQGVVGSDRPSANRCRPRTPITGSPITGST